jgi:hypothetical protein
MDPFDSEVLHEDVHRYIAQHFSGKDLLTMSEVSISWNEFAENKIGDKVRLNFNSDSISTRDFKIIASSSRNYKDVSVDVGETVSCVALCLTADTAEKLNVDFTDSDNDNDNNGRDFSKLKSLDLTLDNSGHWILQSKMEQLEELKLALNFDSYESANDGRFIYDSAHEFLSRLKNLKRLDVSDCDDEFLHYFHDHRLFKLEYFKGDINYNMQFVNAQRKSLQSLSSNLCRYELQDLLSKFPKLTTLEFTQCCDKDWDRHRRFANFILPVNTTIKILKLQFMRNQLVNVCCRELLLALPELESLDIKRLTTDMMELIALDLLKLKELKSDSVEDGAWERYEEMKREGIKEVNSEIKLSISIKLSSKKKLCSSIEI